MATEIAGRVGKGAGQEFRPRAPTDAAPCPRVDGEWGRTDDAWAWRAKRAPLPTLRVLLLET
jgi:hypothetical protein